MVGDQFFRSTGFQIDDSGVAELMGTSAAQAAQQFVANFDTIERAQNQPQVSHAPP